MKRAYRMMAAMLAATVLPLVGSHAVAAAGRVCEFEVTGELKCTVVAEPEPPLTVQLGDTTLVWRRWPYDVEELRLRGIGCFREVNGVSEEGVMYWVTLSDSSTGELLYVNYLCTWPGEPPPQPPPPPPTLGEFRDAAVEVLTLGTAMSPRAEFGGITGVDTWLWCADPGTVAVSVSLRGWTAAASVEAVRVAWRVGGAAEWSVESSACGSESDPVATWQPQTAGSYTVSLDSTWAGVWELSYLGIDAGVQPLGPVSFTSTPITYPVDEFVGVLVAGEP